MYSYDSPRYVFRGHFSQLKNDNLKEQNLISMYISKLTAKYMTAQVGLRELSTSVCNNYKLVFVKNSNNLIRHIQVIFRWIVFLAVPWLEGVKFD